MKRILVATTAIITLDLLSAAHADAATFKPAYKGTALVMTGKIDIGDIAWLTQAYLASCNKRGYCPSEIYLNSPGGSVGSGLELARYVRAMGMTTIVGPTDECVSICVTIFAAGTHLKAYSTSMIGVHSASLKNNYTGEKEDALEATVVLARVMDDLGVPAIVIAKLVTTPSDDMAYIKASDWPGIEIIEAGYAAPDNPAPQTSNTVSMTCQGKRGQYEVLWSEYGMQIGPNLRSINEWHQNAKTSAYVATGQTPYGTYQAVFGGQKPRLVFSNGRETVTDLCWGVR